MRRHQLSGLLVLGLVGWMLNACGPVVEDTASSMNVVAPESGKSDGTMAWKTGYVLIRGVATHLNSSDSPYLHLPTSGWVTLYSYFGTNLGQADLSYYQSKGIVRWGTCIEQKRFSDPFRDSTLGYDNFLCELKLGKPLAEKPTQPGFVWAMIDEIDPAGNTVEGSEKHVQYIGVKKDGSAEVMKKTFVVDSVEPKEWKVLGTVGVGSTLKTFDFDKLVSIYFSIEDSENRLKLMVYPVMY